MLPQLCGQRKFEGVVMSDCVWRDFTKKRNSVRYLSFGAPPVGENGGNTPAGTHRLLRIVNKALTTKQYHQDGGWTQAIKVHIDSLIYRVSTHALNHLHMFVLCSICEKGLVVCQLFADL